MDRRDFPSESPVVVLGGGPAGATVSALLAADGHQVLLLEREKFPRFHIGESLMPETYWTLQKLGVLDKLEASRSPVKARVQFISDSGKTSPSPSISSTENPTRAPIHGKLNAPGSIRCCWTMRPRRVSMCDRA